MYLISELKKRNITLFWFGVLNLLAAIACLLFWQFTDRSVNGINAFIKPFKFYFSIAIFVWTVGWLFYYLDMPRKIKIYNIMVIIVMAYESFVITWQAANGRLSHFNASTKLYGNLFMFMGIAIVLLTLWTGYLGLYFFKKKEWMLPQAYLWGIRLGVIFFVVFALEGGAMAAIMRHTVGGADGGQGLPLVNWNRQHGDLRIAHFLGMHSLQLFPFLGYHITRTSKSMIAFATIYGVFSTATLIQAVMGRPFL